MTTAGWLITLEAKEGKEDEVAAVLARDAVGTTLHSRSLDWFALQTAAQTFTVFAGLGDDRAVAESVQRDLMEHLGRHTGELLTGPPGAIAVHLLRGSVASRQVAPQTWASTWVGSWQASEQDVAPAGWSSAEWTEQSEPSEALKVPFFG